MKTAARFTAVACFAALAFAIGCASQSRVDSSKSTTVETKAKTGCCSASGSCPASTETTPAVKN